MAFLCRSWCFLLLLATMLGAPSLSAAHAGEATVPPGTVTGKLEWIEGVPIGFCTANIVGTPMLAKCARDGTFRFNGVPEGRAEIEININSSFDAPPARFAFAASADAGVDFGILRPWATGSVVGKVTNLNLLRTGTVVYLTGIIGIRRTTTVGEYGTFAFQDVVPGSYSVQALSPGKEIGGVTSTWVQPGQAERVVIELRRDWMWAMDPPMVPLPRLPPKPLPQ